MVEFNLKKQMYLAGLLTENARLEIVEGESYPRPEVEEENPALLGGEIPYDPHHTSLEDELHMDIEQRALAAETVTENKIRRAIRREIDSILKEMTPSRSGALGRSSAGGGHGGGFPTRGQIRGAHGELTDVCSLHGLEDEDDPVRSLAQALGFGVSPTSASTSGRPGHSPSASSRSAGYRPGHSRRGQALKGPGFR